MSHLLIINVIKCTLVLCQDSEGKQSQKGLAILSQVYHTFAYLLTSQVVDRNILDGVPHEFKWIFP